MALDLRPLTLGDVIDRAFRLYRGNFAVFLGIAAVALVPEAAVAMALGPSQAALADPDQTVKLAALGRVMALMPITVLAVALSQAALSFAIAERYLGRSAGIFDSYRRALRHLPSLLGAVVLSMILAGVATLFLIIPGVYVFLGLVFAPSVVIIERVGAFAAMSRSWRLARGDRGRIFVLILLMGVIFCVVWVSAIVLVGLVVSGETGSGLAQRLAQLLAQPVTQAAYVVLYFDDRVRKEGFDVEVMAAQLAGQPLPVAPPPLGSAPPPAAAS